MKKEIFCDILGDIDEKYVKQARVYRRRFDKTSRIRIRVLAACLCLFVLGGTIYFDYTRPKDFNKKLSYFSLPTLKNSQAELRMCIVNIGEHTAVYYESSSDSEKLEKYVGLLHHREGGLNYYYPKGYSNLKYLIEENEDGELSLWCYNSYQMSENETYTYGDVLKNIYGVDSADDIVSIKTTPSKGNNTSLGQQIQREVGTHTYKNREDIETFYDIVKDVVCFGGGRESVADSGRFTYSFSTESDDKLTSGESTYATRCITITLKDGTTISSWIYSALSGGFYEYGGIFTEPLSDEDVYKINEIFGIK